MAARPLEDAVVMFVMAVMNELRFELGVGWLSALLVASSLACAGGSESQRHYGAGVAEGESIDAAISSGGRGMDERVAIPRNENSRLAVDTPPPAPPGAELASTAGDDSPEPVPESGEPILIYTATLYMGVYQVLDSQRQVIELADALGGFLSSQDDTTVRIRVPADRFEEAIERIEGLGDITHRSIQVQDVSEEYHDLNIRLESMRATRDRLQELLDEAETVADAVLIERELERLTLEIETIQGRLRFLRDRVAFSTITVTFQSIAPNVGSQRAAELPFPWLSQLGLNNLLYLW